MVADAVKIPVITGGGIGDARGVMAAIALGADGVYMGTRFMVTNESESHSSVKEAVVKGQDACTLTLNKGFMLARDLSNEFTKKYLELTQAGKPADDAIRSDLSPQYRAQHLGEAEKAEICCGQVAGLIDGVESAEGVMLNISDRMSAVFDEVKEKLNSFM
jgi:NAD(P)H-dependent flavin oxidoreductase YrpB (nitropropane dioxygenase family)